MKPGVGHSHEKNEVFEAQTIRKVCKPMGHCPLRRFIYKAKCTPAVLNGTSLSDYRGIVLGQKCRVLKCRRWSCPTARTAVGEISTNDILDDKFDLHYDVPDTHILNATLANEDMRPDGGISYFAPKNPGDLDKVILKATEEAIMLSEKDSASIWLRCLLITSNVLIIVCILALIYRRIRKTK